ncbi:MAG TPA: 30S ribosomal protein S9 [Planctomycetes bacterium]|nr:30S ribosomal protein S9 [Fuerstiella sp.]HIK95239.1 30S ribosomal protein S9 [Planctomycetota bacterium]
MSTDETPSEEVPEKAAAPEVAAETPEPAVETPEPAVEAAVETPEVAAPEPEVPETEVPSSDLPELSLGSGTSAENYVDPDYVPVMRGKIDRFGVAMGTGRRKTSVARVRIKNDGSGKVTINGKSLDEYFCVERDRGMILAPLKLVGKDETVDVIVRVNGGGTTGQTGAIVLGIGRALQGLVPESHQELSAAGFLTRDSRMVERKKYGLRKARRSFQFSKR